VLRELFECTDSFERAATIFPDAGPDTEIAQMCSPLVDTYGPATLGERGRECQTGEPGAGDLSPPSIAEAHPAPSQERWFVMFTPVFRHLLPAADPDPFDPADVIEEAFDPLRAGGMAEQSVVKAHRHEFRMRLAPEIAS
jgi:hypothetical protein